MSDNPDKPVEGKVEATMGAMTIEATAVSDILRWLERIEQGQGALSTELKAEIANSGSLLRSDLDAAQTQLRAEITQLRVDLMARMDRLQNRVDPLPEQLWVNYSQADLALKNSHAAENQLTVVMRLVLKLTDRVAALEEKRP